MRQDLFSYPPSHYYWSRVMRLLVEIRDDFVSLTDAPNAFLMKELVDTELIRQQMEAGGCFGQNEWSALLHEMYAIIKNAQKTVQRQHDLQARWDALTAQSTGHLLCEALKLLMDSVRLLKTDLMNER